MGKATRKGGLSDVNSEALKRRNEIVYEIYEEKFCYSFIIVFKDSDNIFLQFMPRFFLNLYLYKLGKRE